MGELREVEQRPGRVVELIDELNPKLGKIAALVERGLRRLRRRRADREAERIHRAILNGEAPSFGRDKER